MGEVEGVCVCVGGGGGGGVIENNLRFEGVYISSNQ